MLPTVSNFEIPKDTLLSQEKDVTTEKNKKNFSAKVCLKKAYSRDCFPGIPGPEFPGNGNAKIPGIPGNFPSRDSRPTALNIGHHMSLLQDESNSVSHALMGAVSWVEFILQVKRFSFISV